MGGELFEQARHAGDVAELVRHLGAVEVRAEGDVLDADPFGDVAGVANDQVERRAGGSFLPSGRRKAGA